MKYKKLLIIFILIICIILHNTLVYADSNLMLENFTYSAIDKKATLDVTDNKYLVMAFSYVQQPYLLSAFLEDLNFKDLEFVGYTNDLGQVTLNLYEEQYNHDNFFVFVKDGLKPEMVGYVEILRQSEYWLKTLYNFDKPNGYCLFGRTNLILPKQASVINLGSLTAVKMTNPYPDLTNFYPSDNSMPLELKESAALMKYLWSEPLTLGPSNLNSYYANFDPIDRLEALRSGAWATQCSAIRNIFMDIAINSPNIQGIRKVSLYQYWTEFPGLISNSHAVAEVYCQSLNKWVIVDPWRATYLTYNGQYMSLDDINNLIKEERQQVNFVSVVESRSYENAGYPIDYKELVFTCFGVEMYNDIIKAP